MRRLFFLCVIQSSLGILIFCQFRHLKELSLKQIVLRRDVTVTKILPLPNSAVEMPPVDRLVSSKHLEELKRAAEKGPGGVPLLHPQDLFKEFPQLERDFIKAKRGQLYLENLNFFKLAGLSTDQVQRFIELRISGELNWVAAYKEKNFLIKNTTNSALSELTAELATNKNRDLEELLGPDKVALWSKYREERASRKVFAELATASALSRDPITFDQLNQLVNVSSEIRLFEQSTPELSTFDAVSLKAAKILSKEQLELFDLIIESGQAHLVRKLDRRNQR